MAVLACAAFAACEQENPVTGDQVADKDQAYLQIQLVNAPSTTTRGESGGFDNGIGDESTVKTVEFYFYNADGTYNQHVSKSGIEWTEQTDGGNVEQIAKNATVVLENLKEIGKPRYVVAVLNGVEKEYINKSLAELKEAIVEGVASYKTTNGFLMTNSTYNNEDATSEYFATKIEDNNFLNEKPTKVELTKDNAVQIYVERLAVKVGITTDNGLIDGNNELSLGNDFDIDGTTGKTIKIKITGWALNAVNKTEFVEKNVENAWTEAVFANWTAPNLFRCYWAASPNYGGGTYPMTYAYSKEESNPNIDGYTLDYVSWNEVNGTLSSAAYCLENTNTDEELEKNNFNAKVTHVLIAAQTTTKEDLVRYDGRLWTMNGFINIVLNQTTAYKVADNVYTKIEPTDVQVIDIYDGNVTVGLTEAAKALTWSSTKGETTALTVEEIEADLVELVDAEYYKEGMMYYHIPIEHLAGGSVVYDDNLAIQVDEGDYGVVRNHYYQLAINSIQNLGTSVYNPDEEIVPNMEIPTYYVGASINILAWHVVNQDVEL